MELSDDVFVYGGPRSHRIFPPPTPSGTSVDAAKVDNDVERRLFGLNERAVYEEALKVSSPLVDLYRNSALAFSYFHF